MKKTLTVLASAVLALGMLFVMGCKQPTMNADDAGNWKGQTDVTDSGTNGKLYIQVNKGTLNWWCVTDLNNEVINVGKPNKAAKEKAPFEDEIIDLSSLTFNKGKKDVVLWINTTGLKDGKNSLNDSTLVGKVTLKADKGRRVKVDDYKNIHNKKMGLLQITCNEKPSNTKWHGTYEITEAVPLLLTKGDSYEADDAEFAFVGGLRVKRVIEPGKKATFIWPVEAKSRVAISQPHRFDTTKAPENFKETEQAAANKQEGWYWTIVSPVEAWSTTAKNIDSSACTQVVSLKGKQPSKDSDRAAVDTLITVKESDFFDAADEK